MYIIVRVTCLRFLVSPQLSVEYWILLTIHVARHIPTNIWSHIWQSIRSNRMFFVNKNRDVAIDMPSRL